MRLRPFSHSRARRTVVDLGASHAVRAEFERTAAGGLRWVACETARHRTEAATDDAWRKAMSGSMARIGGAWRRGGADVWVGLPGHLALTKWVNVPAIAGAKRKRLIRFEAAQAIPYPLAQVAWDYEVAAADGAELQVLLAAAKTEVVEAVGQVAKAAGWALAGATPACVALHRGFRHNHPDATGCSLLVNVGARSTHLLFIEPERYSGRTLVLGGDTVTRAIAEEFRIDFVDAEEVKCGATERAAVRRAAEAFAARLAVETVRSQAGLGRQGAAPQPTRVYLSGGGAALEALPALLAEKFKLPVERYDPLKRVEVAPSLAANAVMRETLPLAELVGLACIAWKTEGAAGRGLNLLTPEMIDDRKFRRRRPVLLAAAACAACALWSSIPYFGATTAAGQRAVAEREAQLRPVRLARARVAAQQEELAALQRQIALARERAAAKSAWVGFLGDLQQRLSAVEDGWIESLSLTASGTGGDDDAANGRRAPERRLRLSGRLLDTGAASQERAKRLLTSLASSPFVAAIEDERFDRSQPGVLRMDFTLVAKPGSAL